MLLESVLPLPPVQEVQVVDSPEQVAQVYEQAAEEVKNVFIIELTLTGGARSVIVVSCVARTVAA